MRSSCVYEQLLAAGNPAHDFRDFDENTRATTFYTTGTTGLPKGVFFSHRQIVLHTLSEVLRESIDAGLANREAALDYALGFGRGMGAERGDRFIDMYVNDLTLDFGDEGRLAVRELFARAEAVGAYDAPVTVDFVE